MGIEAVVTGLVVLAATARAALVHHAPPGRGGSRVVVLGDSVTKGDRHYLKPALSAVGWADVKVDGEPCRRIPASASEPYSGVKIVRALRAAGASPDAFVIALGTNDIGFVVEYHQTPRKLISEMLDAIGPGRRVLWVDVVQPDLPEGAAWFNRTLAEMAEERPGQLLVLRWSRAAAAHHEWFLDDGIHLSEIRTRPARRARRSGQPRPPPSRRPARLAAGPRLALPRVARPLRLARRARLGARVVNAALRAPLRLAGRVRVREELVLEVRLPLHQRLAEQVRDQRGRRGGEAGEALDQHD